MAKIFCRENSRNNILVLQRALLAEIGKCSCMAEPSCIRVSTINIDPGIGDCSGTKNIP